MQLEKKIELTQNTQKPFPFNTKAEKWVLGALFIDSGAILRIIDILAATHFYNEKYGNIYAACLSLFKNGGKIDYVTVLNEYQRLNPKKPITPYELVELGNSVAVSHHIEDHAQIVKDKWAQREMMRIGNKMLYMASAPTRDIKEMLGLFGYEHMKLTQEAIPERSESKQDVIRKISDRALNPSKSGLRGLSTGIKSLDYITNGLEAGDMFVIGGRPAMGKTSLLTTIAYNVAFGQNKPIVFFSYEMTKEQIYERMASMISGVSSKKIGAVKLSDVEQAAYQDALDQIYTNDTFIFVDGLGMDALALRAKCLQLNHLHKIEAIFVDYLQRMPMLKTSNRNNKNTALGDTMKVLTNLALELNKPVVIPSQLSRVSAQHVRRPTLTDLRESGEIEQEAVKALFIHRPEYYKIEQFDNGTPTKGKAELILAKNRKGEIDDIIVDWDAPTTTFFDSNYSYPSQPETIDDENDDIPF